jgi:hypothetical protein
MTLKKIILKLDYPSTRKKIHTCLVGEDDCFRSVEASAMPMEVAHTVQWSKALAEKGICKYL